MITCQDTVAAALYADSWETLVLHGSLRSPTSDRNTCRKHIY